MEHGDHQVVTQEDEAARREGKRGRSGGRREGG